MVNLPVWIKTIYSDCKEIIFIFLTVKGGGALHGDIPEVMAYRLGGPYTVRGFKMSGVGTGNAFIMGSAEFANTYSILR